MPRLPPPNRLPQPRLPEGPPPSRPGPVAEVLPRALALRQPLLQGSATPCLRLIDGEVPGVYLDRYGRHCVLQRYVDVQVDDPASVRLHLQEGAALAEVLSRILAPRLGIRSIWLKLRPRQANTLISAQAAGLTPAEPVWTAADLSTEEREELRVGPLVVHEHGLQLRVFLGQGLATGLYLDQRDNRLWVQQHAKGRRFLNTFCYTAAFSVAAAAGAAVKTVSIDAAAPALAEARANLLLNGFASDGDHDLIRGDALAWLAKMAKRGDRFDAAVLDPPSYSTVKGKRWKADRDYPVLVAATAAALDPGAWLLACVNASGATAADLRQWVVQGCHAAGKPLAGLEIRPASLDHPEQRMKSVLARLR